MDRKSIIVIVVCAALMFLWPKMTDKILGPKPAPPVSTNSVVTAQAPGITQTNTTTAAPSVISSAPVRVVISTNTAEETLVITNENARYTFTSRGGGLKEIALMGYPETITRQSKKNPLTNGVVTLNSQAQVPVLAVLGDENIQGDGVFTLSATTNGVRAEKSLANGLRVVKDFQLGTNYLVHATVRLENSSSNALALPAQEWVAGTATPMGWDDDGSAVGVAWYDGAKKQEVTTPWFENRTMGCSFFAERLRPKYEEGASNVVWAVPNNQFFVLAAMPDSPAQKIVARVIYLPRPTQGRFSDTKNPPPKGYETVLIYPGVQIAPGGAVERKFNLFIGPKEYRTLARIGDRFQNNVDLVMGFGGFFGFFAKVLLLAMNGLHQLLNLPSYGWAIIAITIILKIVFWPLTAISTRSAQRMAALAPQMTAVREKYKDDALKMQQKMSELYREHKINPVAGCLPILVQLPVFFGFFTMLRTAIELRGAGFFWATDLSKPDTLFVIPGLNFIPFGISTPDGLPFNLLPLLYITTSIWQMHATPPSPGMDPTQQRLMRWMPLMFLAILYNFSSGLALYMTINNLLTILQTKMTKKPDATAPASPAQPQKHSALTPVSKKKK